MDAAGTGNALLASDGSVPINEYLVSARFLPGSLASYEQVAGIKDLFSFIGLLLLLFIFSHAAGLNEVSLLATGRKRAWRIVNN